MLSAMKLTIAAILMASCASTRSIVAVPLSHVSANYPEDKATVVFVVPAGYRLSRNFVGHHDVDYVIYKGDGSSSRVVLTFGMRMDRTVSDGRCLEAPGAGRGRRLARVSRRPAVRGRTVDGACRRGERPRAAGGRQRAGRGSARCR